MVDLMTTLDRPAQNGYCSRDIYLQFEMFARSVIVRVIIQKRSGRT